jgi:CubicO group peptidase (beta-lactamase class C family)
MRWPTTSSPWWNPARLLAPGFSARARSRSAAVPGVLQAEATKPSLKRPSEVSCWVSPRAARQAGLALICVLGVLACERESEREPEPAVPELAVPPEPPELGHKRECVERLLAEAEPRFHGLLRSLCAQWVNQAVPGIAVAVIEHGELQLHVELGVRCLDRPEPVDPATAFRVGSISKTFTAALVLESFDRAALAGPVALPELAWPSGMATPTLEALLRHRSGLGEILPGQFVAFQGAWKPALAHSPVAGHPGEWHYSNAGYVVLGALLEAKTGGTYEELLRSHVAAFPTITSDPSTSSNAACGHLPEGEGLRAIAIEHDLDFMPGDPSWLHPTGGVLSSAEDLARFGASLDGSMLEPGEPLARADWRHRGTDERYGLGLRSWVLPDGTRVFGHSGNTGSFAAQLVVAPTESMAIALLANAPVRWEASLLAIETLLSRSNPRPPPDNP